jgi:hypothetical protein
MIFDFFESAGWWMLAAVGILWFMATRGKGKEFAPQPLNWAFLLSCALMAFAFGSLITVKSSGQVPTVIVGWGGNATQCNAVVDTTRLLSFKDTHKIVLVCGIENQTIDKMADERILISNPFDIRPGGVAITANFSPKMDELKGIQGVVQVWEMIALVPPGVSREKISKLADIDNLGGKLVAPGYYK